MKVVGLDWKRHEKRRGRSDVTTRKSGSTDDAGMLARVCVTAQVDSIIRTMHTKTEHKRWGIKDVRKREG